ncbi:DUF3305 domain-containing protein [Sulfitobacter mediterraneus]|uniref:DUF3305 domain-containing protein n=1 Tax=Sulfitobacter mediterraneus TaxID=83219 RepID=UPI001933602A|nr:DUF3305 domain-containing protein [Sulfitobacter mediterraneus]MBM1633577.1 DUF3305 domain-containing protein [Sulfitobacter mediterraneus]MBM1641908.1 DUF3305 domain-containing protein [Sulfitobacter mediterraneus]MBM1645441.1 DUF3305 domain-containing protein [Sulfitobacter mediterraneus]MBM1650027.1 DUF3305 domain-containing protein [Sulfitobacter mediterraneus]MBM1653510.1 DUF3305 domain-containing protein [Sulfitobacter mediterraneus]
MPMGVVLRRTPGVTRWAKWSWRAVGVLPGAAEANWAALRKDGEITEFHAATLMLELHGAETDAYLHGLAAQVPCLYVVMRETDDAARPFDLVLITASPYEAQDYADNGEDVVEKIAMPPIVIGWVEAFAQRFHTEEVFKKRRRDKKDIGLVEDGIGDVRIAQMADVYRAPSKAKKERLQ